MSEQENGFLSDGERDGALPTMLQCAGNPCRASERQRHGDEDLSICSCLHLSAQMLAVVGTSVWLALWSWEQLEDKREI